MSGEYIPDYRRLTVVEAMPSIYAREKTDVAFARLREATIVRIGTPEEDGIEGGGLVIDYLRPGSALPDRLVLASTDLGMWVEWQGPILV